MTLEKKLIFEKKLKFRQKPAKRIVDKTKRLLAMIDKINKNQISDILKGSSARQAGQAKVSASNNEDALLQISYDTLIEKANQAKPEDSNAVQRAYKLLLSGELEKPENIRAAAENLVMFGI